MNKKYSFQWERLKEIEMLRFLLLLALSIPRTLILTALTFLLPPSFPSPSSSDISTKINTNAGS